MNSAIATPSVCGRDVLVELYRAIMDSGEFIVMVAAVEMPSHEGRPSLRSVASSCILWYTAWMRGGAGTGPGRECAALMRDLRAGDSFDIVGDSRLARKVVGSCEKKAFQLSYTQLDLRL
jgi:hypothetical protein